MKDYTKQPPFTVAALEFAINQICWDIDQGTLKDGPLVTEVIHSLQALRNSLSVFDDACACGGTGQHTGFAASKYCTAKPKR